MPSSTWGSCTTRVRAVPQDYQEATKWYRIAAEKGNPKAQVKVGFMYNEGRGVSRDRVRAHTWFNLAASQGNKTGDLMREILASMMTPEQIAEAQRLATNWKPENSRVRVIRSGKRQNPIYPGVARTSKSPGP